MKLLKEIISDRVVYSIQKDATVLEAAKFMTENKIGLVPILDGEKLVGVFSERDLMHRVVVTGKSPAETKVSEVMSTNLIIGDENESYQEGLTKMQKAGIRHLLVISNDRLIGVVSMRDLLQMDLSLKNETLEVLHNYIYAKPKVENP